MPNRSHARRLRDGISHRIASTYIGPVTALDHLALDHAAIFNSSLIALAGPKLLGPPGVTPYPTIAFMGNSHTVMYAGLLSELADEYRTRIGILAHVPIHTAYFPLVFLDHIMILVISQRVLNSHLFSVCLRYDTMSIL